MKAASSLVIAAVTLAAVTVPGRAAAADAPQPGRPVTPPPAGPAEPGTITVRTHIRHGDNTMTLPSATLESGQPVTVWVEAVKLAILATTQKDGTVVITSALTTAAGTTKPVQFAQTKVQVKAGKTATIKVGEREVTFTPTVNK